MNKTEAMHYFGVATQEELNTIVEDHELEHEEDAEGNVVFVTWGVPVQQALLAEARL